MWRFKNKAKDFSLRRIVVLTEEKLILLSENELETLEQSGIIYKDETRDRDNQVSAKKRATKG